MNVVVTGATSFIGVPMIKRLSELGHHLFAVTRPGSRNRHRLSDDLKGVTVIPMELEDLNMLSEHIPVSCDVFLHMGWDGAGSHNRTDRQVQQKNVSDSLKALEEAKKLGCKTFLFTGSQAEYGICTETMTENLTCRPISQYGIAKADFCREAMARCGQGMKYIHARLFSIYGPGDHPWSLVESCLKAFQEGETISLGACTQMWNFLYIDDLIDALLALTGENVPAGIYNIAGSREETRQLSQYVELMYEICGRKGGYTYGKRPPNAEGCINLIPDITKLCSATGWRQKTSFEAGIRTMINKESGR